MCCDPVGPYDQEPDGECPKCGAPTFQGVSITICAWSPEECDECGDAPCDGSC